MVLFSQRYGYTKIRETLQHESIDENFKTALWNVVYELLLNKTILFFPDNNEERLYLYLWKKYFNQKSNEFNSGIFKRKLEAWFFYEAAWNDVYDFLQLVAEYLYDEKRRWDFFTKVINQEMINHVAAYRFIETNILEITTEQEIKEIETALNSTLEEINIQLKNSLQHLSNRENPDYRNSIKESISAVECICRKITGKSTLGKAIADLENKGLELNNQLKEGLKNLYNYTNDENGIRHTIMDLDEEVNMEDARFMLVTCSAFVNYLLEKVNKLNIELK